jgi:hypothetical protein
VAGLIFVCTRPPANQDSKNKSKQHQTAADQKKNPSILSVFFSWLTVLM